LVDGGYHGNVTAGLRVLLVKLHVELPEAIGWREYIK